MTYEPKTYAERWFRLTTMWSRSGNRRQKPKKNSWGDDGWWVTGHNRRLASLKTAHETEMRNWEDTLL